MKEPITDWTQVNWDRSDRDLADIYDCTIATVQRNRKQYAKPDPQAEVEAVSSPPPPPTAPAIVTQEKPYRLEKVDQTSRCTPKHEYTMFVRTQHGEKRLVVHKGDDPERVYADYAAKGLT